MIITTFLSLGLGQLNHYLFLFVLVDLFAKTGNFYRHDTTSVRVRINSTKLLLTSKLALKAQFGLGLSDWATPIYMQATTEISATRE
jgi:hypothetical protein